MSCRLSFTLLVRRKACRMSETSFTPDLQRVAVFMGAEPSADNARVVLFGCPYDGTTSFRPGARFGPPAIRNVSDGLETFCPVLGLDLEDVRFADVGDLVLPPGDRDRALELIYQMACQVHARGQIPAALGGEHLLTLPLVRAALRYHPDLCVVQFDAHMDLRNEYLGVSLSHATVMRRVGELIRWECILQVGQRSGTQEEWELSERSGIIRTSDISPAQIREWVGDRPLYVTVDLDVLDPSVLPGTGTPEPGGVTFLTLQNWLVGLQDCKWVGWDVMELAPLLDASQVSSIVSAKIVRTLILTSGVQ